MSDNMGLLTENEQERDERFMRMALNEARQAAEEGEVPVGAVIVCGDHVIARGHNLTERLNDVTAHAEMIAITSAAGYLNGKYLPQCTLYVTVEPCSMCAGAIGWSQVGRLVYGTSDEKRGFHTYYETPRGPLHPKTIVKSGVLENECREEMQKFFRAKR